MEHVIDYDVYKDLNELYELFIEFDFNNEDVIDFLINECDYDLDDINIIMPLNEGALWDKIKQGASNAKYKLGNAYNKTKEVAGRVKDHVKRNKYKYAAGALALSGLGGLGLAAAPFLLGVGHVADKQPNYN